MKYVGKLLARTDVTALRAVWRTGNDALSDGAVGAQADVHGHKVGDRPRSALRRLAALRDKNKGSRKDGCYASLMARKDLPRYVTIKTHLAIPVAGVEAALATFTTTAARLGELLLLVSCGGRGRSA